MGDGASTCVPEPGPGAATPPAGQRRLPVVLVILLAIGLRFGVAQVYPLIQQETALSRGSDGYEKLAETLASGHGYRFAPELGETMFMLPAYPLFLAGLFRLTEHHLLAAQLAQSLLDAVTCYLIYALGCRHLGARASLLGALAYALYPGAWIMCSRFVTETLFVFLVTVFVYAFTRYLKAGKWPFLALASASCALAVLCKSVAGMLPVFVLACAPLLPAFRGIRLRTVAGLAVTCAVVAVAVSPWVYRNYRVTGSYVYPSTSGGLALYTAHVYASHPDQTIRKSVHQAAAEVRALGEAHGVRMDPRDSYPRWFYDPADELKLDRLARETAMERITADRGAFARHVVGNLWRFWFGAPTPRTVLFSVVANGPLLVLGVIGLICSRFWRNAALAVWTCVAAYLFLSHVAILSVVRYSLTVMPLVCLYAGYCVWLLWLRRAGRAAMPAGAETAAA